MPTDKKYLDWIRRQPSALSGEFSEYFHGEGRSIAAHVRRGSNGGTAYKPQFSAIPLRQEEHLFQHQHGEKACLEKYLGGKWTVEGAKAWFDGKAVEYFERWRNSC